MRARRGLICSVFALLISIAAPVMLTTPAQAQGWSVQGGSARTREIIRRYKILLERNPDKGLAYKKLLELTGRGKGLDALIEEYTQKLKDDPNNWKFALLLGHFYHEKSEYKLASEAYGKAVELGPKEPLAYVGRGTALLMLQQNKEANADFERALELETNRARKQEILRKLADVAFAQRDWERAQEYYDRLVKLDPRNEYLRMEYAQVLVKYKRFEKAIEQYEALIQIAGRNIKARATTMRDLGDLYEKMGADDKALDTYKKAQGYVRASNWLYRELEQRIIGVYRRTDRLAEYVSQREKSWRSPSYDQAMTLAALYDELGREDDALAMYKRARARNGRSPEPRAKIIQIYQRRGLNDEVLAEYQALVRVSPRDARYQFEIAKIHARNGDLKKSQQVLSSIKSRFRRDPDVLVTLADTYMRLGMNKEALGVYQMLVQAEPRNDSFILSLGEYYFQNGDVEKALKTWERVLRAELSKADAHARLGEVLVTHELLDRGIKHYEQAVKLAPKDRQILRGLARAYEQGRRWEPAVKAWETLMRAPDAQPHQRAEARGRIVDLYRRQGRLRSKMRGYDTAFKNDKASASDRMEAGLLLAESHAKLSELDEAERVYRALVALDGKTDDKDIETLVALEKVLAQRGQIEGSIKILQQLATLRPRRAKEYYQRIAELSLKTYDDTQAVKYAKLALEQNPDDATARARLAKVWAKMQKTQEAIREYRVALDLDPRAFDVYFELAALLVGQGQREEAIKLYKEVAKRSFDESLVLQASRQATSLARSLPELEALESDFAPLVFRTPPKPVYRDIMLELYGRMTNELIAQSKFGGAESTQARARLKPIANRAFPILMDALQSDDVRQRQFAVRLLGDLQINNSAVTLARLVHDPKEPLRLQAAIAVALIGDPRASADLVRALDDSNAAVRDAATWALGASGGKNAVAALRNMLTGGQNSSQQALAAVGLARLGGQDVAAAVRTALKRSREQRYADLPGKSTLWATGYLRDAAAVPALKEAMSFGNPEVVELAAWGLGRVGDEAATRALFESYWSGDATRRAAASRALVQLGADTRGPEDLYQHFTREGRFINERDARFDTRKLLDQLFDETRVVPIRGSLAHVYRHPETIAAVAEGRLKASVPEAQRAQVLDDLSRPDHALGLTALDDAYAAPLSSGHKQVLRRLAPLLRRVAGSAQAGADDALVMLGIVGERADLPMLLQALKAPQAARRAGALRGLKLGYLSAAQLPEAVITALGDDTFTVRLIAAQIAGRLTASDALTRALIGRLKDTHLSVQVAAAQALGFQRAASASQALIGALSGAPRVLEVELVRALATLPGDDARRAVAPYTQHADVTLRQAARPAP